VQAGPGCCFAGTGKIDYCKPMPLKLAIVGRPNVGKSTLFNRLAGKKLAIVDDQPGVTRDRRYASGRLGDLELELIDTAGFEDVSDESLEARMRHQTELAVEEADVSLFIYDAREGVTPLDEVFATLLRRRGKPVIIAANKAEGKAGQSGIGEAYKLGLGEPIPISGEHGEGMAELYAAMLAAFPEDQYADDDDDDDKPIRLAIVGRPNAGKSTLVNRLIGEQRLLTGPEAGITRTRSLWTGSGVTRRCGWSTRPACARRPRFRRSSKSSPPRTPFGPSPLPRSWFW